jgi:hypothetical protein
MTYVSWNAQEMNGFWCLSVGEQEVTLWSTSNGHGQWGLHCGETKRCFTIHTSRRRGRDTAGGVGPKLIWLGVRRTSENMYVRIESELSVVVGISLIHVVFNYILELTAFTTLNAVKLDRCHSCRNMRPVPHATPAVIRRWSVPGCEARDR